MAEAQWSLVGLACYLDSTQGTCDNDLGVALAPNGSFTYSAVSTCVTPCTSQGVMAANGSNLRNCSQNVTYVGNGSRGVTVGQTTPFVQVTINASSAGGQVTFGAFTPCGEGQVDVGDDQVFAWEQKPC
ncbi:MAG: hypothetical protein ACREIC_12435 [Limisphaerales bacterium]